MSEEKLASPLLDGFLMGSPMSEHNGVTCCPAMKEDSDHKYIVKIISVPASQKQLDALLLAGAYRRPEDAMSYYKELADGVVAEAQCLKDLSELEGFQPYEGWQVEPMEHYETGYRIYLLGSYRRSLEKHMRRTMLTHLEAVNLGLDLCSALSTVRRAGYIYADLKPTNIFLGEDKTCRIGDLGFISLDCFRYTALPEKYISAYTAPELKDPMSDLNGTADTYALGMVLYQIYNDGQLPAPQAPDQAYPSPVNADYELAEIILKALSPRVEDRWKDPQEMGQALAAYMQRNSVNETPVTPPSTVIYDPADVVKTQEAPQEEAPAEENTAEENIAEEAEASEETASEEGSEPELPEDTAGETEPTLEQIEQEAFSEPEDETLPTAEDAPDPEEQLPLSQETTEIMEQAEELLSGEPEQIPQPELDYGDGTETADPFAAYLEGQEEWSAPAAPPPRDVVLSDPIYEDAHKEEPRKPKKKHRVLKAILSGILVLVLLAGLGLGGYYAYAHYYLQTIDALTVEGDRSLMTVTVKTDIDSSQLTVACIDTYGNALRQPLVNGGAQFMDLQGDMIYQIKLEMAGTHRLVGETSAIFTTESRTTIVDISAVAGAEDGTVVIDFTVDGPEPGEWSLICSTEGEEPREEIFTGHSVTVSGLTMGKTYTFHLQADGQTQVLGDKQVLTYRVAALTTAENLQVNADGPNGLMVTWTSPADAEVESWKVHCYNEQGFDQLVTVTGNQARFTGIDFTYGYTVEVTAEGMTQPARATISANPVTITDVDVDDSEPGQLTVTWDYDGDPPAGGWLLSYGMDTTEMQNVVNCKIASGVISPSLPGVTYNFTIQTVDGGSIFNNTAQYTAPDAPDFDKYSVTASSLSARLLKTPEDPEWNAGTVSGKDYTTVFHPGEPVSMVIHCSRNFYLPQDPISVLYILRDSEGRVLSRMITKEDLTWSDLWMGGNYHDAELDLPVVPSAAGGYSISIYLNGAFAVSADFTIEEP